MPKKKVIKSKTNTRKTSEVNNAKENEKDEKKLFIPLFCLLGAFALAGIGVGIYFAVQPKTPTFKVDVSTEAEGDITLSKSKATKGKDFETVISVNKEGYTLPVVLTEVTSGGEKIEVNTGYTYALKEENKKADFRILGAFVKGNVTIKLDLVPPKEKHDVYWYNYDGTLLEKDTDVEEGTIPTYDGDDPTNYGDEKTKKTWSGWDHEPEAMGKVDQTYIAKFNDGTVTPGSFFMGINITEDEVPQEIALKYDSEITPTIDWGDGSSSNDGAFRETHTYNKAGQYGIRISGDITSIFNDSTKTGLYHSYIKEIYLGNSITNLPENAFQQCVDLISLRYGDSPALKTIGTASFYGCLSLKKLFIPASVETIEEQAFWPGTTSKYVSSIDEIIFGPNSNLTSIGPSAFTKNNITSLELPNKLETIGAAAFTQCKLLESVTITSADSIGDMAFQSCEKLKEVDLTALDEPPVLEKDTHLGYINFDGCDPTLTFYVKDNATKTKFLQEDSWADYYDRIEVKL